MREILFRGKRIDNGEWVEGSLLKANIGGKIAYLIFGNMFSLVGNEVKSLKHALIAPETVGQYTGLKDKNGKRIFEGDILKDDWGKVYEVIYTTKSCSFMVKLEQAPNEYEKGNYRLGEAWCDTIRVIGNIHDNSERLKR